MKSIATLLFVVIFCGVNIVQADTLDSKQAARNLTDQVMVKVSSGNYSAGLMHLKPYFVIPESEFNVMLEQIKMQTPVMQSRYGNTLGSEFISEKMAGQSLLQIVHIQKFEKHAIRWQFIFYNPKGKWVLNTFNFNDNIQPMFE